MKQIKLKLCGNQSLQDVKLSVSSGADFIGIIFGESKRKVDPVQCGKWLRQIEKGHAQKYVGVFVNQSLEEVLEVLRHVSLDIIQFHGNESPEKIKEITTATKLPAWKAIHHSPGGVSLMKAYQQVVSGYVIDSKVTGAWGGTGQQFDWEVIPAYKQEAERQGVECLIAGGITPDNVDRILTYMPHGIDISSGIETNRQKDYHKIQLLTERLH